MLLVIRYRYPRVANILGAVTGVVSLAIAIACGASMPVLILGGGSSIVLAIVRFGGKRKQLTATR
jgi:hypothetical protein